ncbi:hypothetical protein LCGC14_0917320 [marine sediment metagenome]|uniref:Uncharacterized protein n=1 Tax=marine sediment metagenome TaxID=412755 RepID=A0A0F9RAF7_9ZZZZ
MHLMDIDAWCVDCDWETKGKNAMGNAARHHKKTGHYVQMELYYSQTFGEPHMKGFITPLAEEVGK